jgi:hypothetical protein
MVKEHRDYKCNKGYIRYINGREMETDVNNAKSS